MFRLFLLTLLLYPLASAAQVFKTVDEQGNVSFSDTAPPGERSEQIQVRQPNTTPPPPERPVTQPATAQQETGAIVSHSVSIVSPANETTIPMGPGNFSVSAAVEPALGENEFLQLSVDGTPWGEPQRVTSWSLTNVFRGAHDLTIAVTDADGKQLAGSEPIRVYVLRPSVNFKNRK